MSASCGRREEDTRREAKPAIAESVIRAVEAVLRQLGVADTSGDPDEVFERAAIELNEPLIGIVVASRVPVGAYGLLEYGLRASATVGDAMERLARHYGSVSTRVRVEVGVVAGRRALVFRRREDVAHSRHWIEMPAAAIARRLSDGAGDALCHEVWFRHSAPSVPPDPRYRETFGAPVRFDAPFDALLLLDDAFERPMRTAAPSIATSTDAAMRTLEPDTSAFSDPLRARVRAAILHDLSDGASLPAVARKLKMSSRTLQRSLADRGSSWTREIDDVRRQRALVLVEDEDRKLADVAIELGYRDTGAVSRAFRRWTASR